MDDEVFELATRMAEDANTSRSRLLEQLVGQDHEAYERLTQVATGAEVSLGEFLERAVFLEHLLLRAEAVWNFQPPLLPPPRPWWKLWSKEEREPELPAIVADLRNAA